MVAVAEAPPVSGEPLGPQAAAKVVLEVEAEPVPGQDESAPQSDASKKLPPEQEWRATLHVSIGLATSILARKWKAFETSPEELQNVVDVWVPVCVKYWPAGIPIEFVAGFTTLAVFGPKLLGAINEEKGNRAARAAAARDAEARATRSEPNTHVAS